MRTSTILVAAVASALAMGLASAEEQSFAFQGHDAGADNWFTLAGSEDRNPTITVAPGDVVTVSFEVVGEQLHNWQIDGIEGAKINFPVSPGETKEATFTAPSEPGEFKYYCVPHQSQGMLGTFKVMSVDAGGSTDGPGGTPPADAPKETKSPGFEAVVLLAAAGLVAAVVARRRA